MYIPKHFSENDTTILQQLMRDYSFATLVSSRDDGVPIATPLPMLYESEPAPYGLLKAHMALGNPQWRTFQAEREVLVIFQGPHTYISPSWYEVELSVPTWNYATVHAYGTVRLIEDREELYTHLNALVETHEAQFARPWTLRQLPADYLDRMMKGVVGLTVQITRLEGKFKMSQNRTIAEQAHVVEMLSASTDTTTCAVAHIMQERLAKRE